MLVVGITGTLGAGKGTIVDYLINKRGFKHYSVRQFLITKINELNLPVNRESMTNVANELRAEHSPSYIVSELYKEAHESGSNAVIESIRTPGEIDFLHQQGDFVLIAIDADPRTRFDRIRKRSSETDNVDFNTFLAAEKREMNTADPNKQNLQKCIEMSDITLLNNGDIEELYNQLEAKLINI